MNNTSAPAPTPCSAQPADSGVVPLVGAQASAHANWGIVRISGADATAFLHNQLTQDVMRMRDNDARLAAWCNAKGRMLASFVLVREKNEAPDASALPSYLLLCRRDVLSSFIAKFKMFVLRSKVVIEDATGSMAAYGLLGDAATKAWQAHGGELPAAPWQSLKTQSDGQTRYLVSLYPATLASAATAMPESAAIPRLACLQTGNCPAPAGALLPLDCWEWSETASGVATIEHASSSLFVPQMINFESVGGVSFKKGCYPGQEVVARSQFRGAIKRRGYIATAMLGNQADGGAAATQAQAGCEIWSQPTSGSNTAANAPEPCGTIVQAACQAGHCVVFASLQIHAAEAAQAGQCSLHIGSAEGPLLTVQPLPYPLIEV